MEGSSGNADRASVAKEREREPRRRRDAGIGIRDDAPKCCNVRAGTDAAGRECGSRANHGSPVFEQRIDERRLVAAGVLDAQDAREPVGVACGDGGSLCAGRRGDDE